MRLTLRVWRQKNAQDHGALVTYALDDVSPDSSFLEMLDELNEKLIQGGDEPVAFDSDCREGICGMCSLMIDGVAHGPLAATATCQLHMRAFRDGQTIIVEPFRARPDTQVSTLCIRASAEELPNPNVTKVVRDPQGRALYFSRCPIPYDREGRGVTRFKHIGLYAYRRAALEAFHRLPPSPLELTERLEQLRFLEHGIPIVVIETDEPTIGVDTEEDLRAVEAVFAARPS